MANIREQCSWVHGHDAKEATTKAKDLVRSAVSRVRLLDAQTEMEVPVRRSTLVIGGGVAGIQAALDLADAGYKVVLVEKQPSIGGIMAQARQDLPHHGLFHLNTRAEDDGCRSASQHYALDHERSQRDHGFRGQLHVRILKRARYVKEKECTACGDCAEVCPVIIPDEFNMGLSSRRAIYSPFPQAVPSAYAVDITRCLGHNPIICGKCIEKCKKHCIDFDMNDEEMVFDVGTIIVATGMEVYRSDHP